jgi:Flp pilus assembly protein TadG
MTVQFKTYREVFQSDERGVTSMIFALSLMVLMLFLGCAVDFGRAIHTNQKVTAAADAAVIAAAKGLKDAGTSIADLEILADKYFKENIKGSGGNYATVKNFKAAVDATKSEVKITFDATVPTVFARVAGINTINIKRASTAVFGVRDIEVGLALDVTGSMDKSIGGKKKIAALKEAVAEFATTLMPETPVGGQSIRVGMAPYSASINLGSYASAASAGRSTDGCVTERTTSARYTDQSPTIGGAFQVARDGRIDIDPKEDLMGNVYFCPKAVVKPLTDKRADIIAAVNTYTTDGWTGGHFGAQWAWNLVSEDWATVWGGTSQPGSYSKIKDKKLFKAVILMTDGIFNTAYNNDTSAYQATELCKKMKERGVVVFAVAFAAPDDAKKTLQDCATPGDAYFADASNPDDLKNAFKQFAATIGALRISQ